MCCVLRGLVILEHIAPEPGAEAVKVVLEVHVAVARELDVVEGDRLVLRIRVPVFAFQKGLELSQVRPLVVREEAGSLDLHAVRDADHEPHEVGKGHLQPTIAPLWKEDEEVVQDRRLLALGALVGRIVVRGDSLIRSGAAEPGRPKVIDARLWYRRWCVFQ